MSSLFTRREVLGVLAGLPAVVAVRSAVAADQDAWKPLFDGESLAGWKRTDFAAGGEVRVEKGFRGGPAAIVVEMGERLSGLNWTKEVPRNNYEIELEAMKLKGDDFFCGLTFPVADSHATLVVGGWGGGVVGISSINDSDASENPTTQFLSFPRERWFKIRMRVTPKKLETWIDEKQVIDQETTGRKISLRPGDISRQVPLGLATYQTSAAYRNLRIRTLK